jgi:hypothetical protein
MLTFHSSLLSLSAKDGQTKDRVEVWRKNLHGLTEEIMKQAKMLEELGEGGAGKTAEGGSELKVDHFDHIVNTVSKEIHELIVICRHVLTLPLQHQSKQKMDSKLFSLACLCRYRLPVEDSARPDEERGHQGPPLRLGPQ